MHYDRVEDWAADLAGALVGAGADVNAQDNTGSTPLHHACREYAEPDYVIALLELGANPALKDNRGRTPLDLARRFGDDDAIVLELKKHH